jgi:hypothetical protein
MRFKKWAARNAGRELVADIDFYNYDKNINPLHGLVPEGVVIEVLAYFEHRDGDDYLQFSNHNVGVFDNKSWFTWRPICYKLDPFGRVISIAGSSSFMIL